jgi:hypothetical protein
LAQNLLQANESYSKSQKSPIFHTLCKKGLMGFLSVSTVGVSKVLWKKILFSTQSTHALCLYTKEYELHVFKGKRFSSTEGKHVRDSDSI